MRVSKQAGPGCRAKEQEKRAFGGRRYFSAMRVFSRSPAPPLSCPPDRLVARERPFAAVLMVVAFAAPWQVDYAGAAELISPVAVPLASGPAFPQGRANGNPPDPEYAAERAIDGDPATFCCLLDDTLAGESPARIPADAAEPVTGHLVFDLGRPVVVSGARLAARTPGGPYNPKSVDFFSFADDDPSKHPTVDDLEGDAGIRVLVRGHQFAGLRAGASEDVSWGAVHTRYVGMRVNSSYESGGGGVHTSRDTSSR